MRVQKVQGTITLEDGSTSAFQISTDGGWIQWGALQERLGRSADALQAMADGLLESDLLVSDCHDSDLDVT